MNAEESRTSFFKLTASNQLRLFKRQLLKPHSELFFIFLPHSKELLVLGQVYL